VATRQLFTARSHYRIVSYSTVKLDRNDCYTILSATC